MQGELNLLIVVQTLAFRYALPAAGQVTQAAAMLESHHYLASSTAVSWSRNPASHLPAAVNRQPIYRYPYTCTITITVYL